MSWVLPTLNRPKILKNFLESAINTKTSTPGLIVVDEKDWEKNRDGYTELPVPQGWGFRVVKGVTMGDKIRDVWDEVKASNWVGLLNDDHYCITENWDVKLLKKLDGKNFVHSNDRCWAPVKATTATVWSMPLLECVGWPIYPPGLQHLYIDDLWLNIGKATGCWRPVMSVVVEHRHVLNGGMAADDTFKKTYDDYFAGKSKDTGVYELLMKHDFPEIVEKIKKFQDELPGQYYKPLDQKTNKFVPTGINMD